MIERVLDYPGYLLRFRPGKPSEQAFLLLHGFPAMRATKNLDLADELFRRFDRDVYLLHYRGLGDSPGTFSFSASIEEAVGVAQRLTEGTPARRLTLVGHSWGGLVATNVAARLPDRIAAMVLLSPFVFAQPDLEAWFVADVRKELPSVFGATSDAEVRAEWERVQQYLPLKVVSGIAADLPIGVIQSKHDETTPASHTKQLVERMPGKPTYRELDLDHSFTQDRRLLAREVDVMIRLLEK